MRAMKPIPTTATRPAHGPEAWEQEPEEPRRMPRWLGWPFTIGVILGAILPLAALVWFGGPL